MADKRLFNVGPSQRTPEDTSIFKSLSADDIGRSGRGKGDVRFSRPYILIPILDKLVKKKPAFQEVEKGLPEGDETFEEFSAAVDRGVEAVRLSGKVTDIYFLSHGWHRNFYSAIAAYDQLMSRFSRLFYRKRLNFLPKEYSPLFLTIHYHSDTGVDDMVDYSGRKSKTSFMHLIFERIESSEGETPFLRARMRNDFEELFELFSKVSAPEIDPFADRIQDEAQELTDRLWSRKYRPKDYELFTRDGSEPTQYLFDEVVTIAWACYHEADGQRATSEQDGTPGKFVGPLGWTSVLIGTILSVVSVFTIVGFLMQIKSLNDWIKLQVAGLERFIDDHLIDSFEKFSTVSKFLVYAGVIYAVSWLVLGVLIAFNRQKDAKEPDTQQDPQALSPENRRKRRKGGLKTWGTIAYLLVQVVHALPILTLCLLTPFFAALESLLVIIIVGFLVGLYTVGFVGHTWWIYYGIAVAVVFGIRVAALHQFKERIGKIDEAPVWYDQKNARAFIEWIRSIRTGLLIFARVPVFVAARALKSDDRVQSVWTAINNQFAFWEMSKNACITGQFVNLYLDELVRRLDGEALERMAGARVHLLGHSHGGLVVVNSGKWFAYSPHFACKGQGVQAGLNLSLQTVTTVNGAYMSAWFDGERKYLNQIWGCAASVFSRYDVANSFWYPLANLGRKASGSVGLWMQAPDNEAIGDPLPSASLVQSPNYAERIARVGQDPRQKKVLNIDGSRLIFEGPVLPQGAHGDIFKEEAVLLLWSTTVYEECVKQYQPPPPGGGSAVVQTGNIQTPTGG